MEGFRPETYGDAFADVYRTWYGEITDAEATASTVDEMSGPGPILELGVGDGRIARPLAVRGRRVIGVDASAGMLSACAQSIDELPITLVRADLARLPLTGPVGGALCAFNTLFNLPDAASQARLFASVADALVGGGALIIEAITGQALGDGPDQSVGISRLEVDRLVLSATMVDPDAQTITGQHVDITESGIRLRPWHLRWTTPEQLDALAEDAGLHRAERWADWDRSTFTADSERHVTVYRRTSTG